MDYVYGILMFMLGALLTSFFQLLAERLPKQKSINGRSVCNQCHQALSLCDVIPIVGFVLRKGKCRHCGNRIPKCYPILEFLGGLIFLSAYIYVGFSFELIVILIMYAVFYIEILTDLRYMIVLDRIWIIGIVPLIMIRIIEGTWKTYAISSVALFMLLYSIAFLAQKYYKKDALGGGDVKLYLFIGWIIPVFSGLLSLFIASLFGFIYGMIKKKEKLQVFPLVPFIFLGVVISYFYGEWLINLYLDLLGM